MNAALKAAEYCDSSYMLWASIPCIGGMAWTNVNEALAAKYTRPATLEMIQQHIVDSTHIWQTFAKVARYVASRQGSIAIGWPRRCKYW